MHRITGNLAIVLFGAASSVLTAVLLIFLEARSGQALFDFAAWTYVPVGAIAAGLVGALGYLAGALAMRIRPGRVVLLGIVAIAVGTVFVAQSAEFSLFLEGSRQAVASAKDFGTFSGFLAESVVHSPLRPGAIVKDGASSDSGSSGSSASSAAPMPQIGIDAGGTRAAGIGEGVQNMLASQDMSKKLADSPQMAQINKISNGIASFGSGVEFHGQLLQMAMLQVAGFVIGGLMIYSFLRSVSYCRDCEVFLGKKGRQTRYFIREREMRGSVDEFLEIAKTRKLQDSIQAHFGKGAGERSRFSAFSSTIEIRRCPLCETHRLNFKAKRKNGATWKDIALLGFSASSIEPIDVART